MRVLYFGSRTWEDEGIIEALVIGNAAQCYWAQEPHVSIVGGAKGADKIAEEKALNEDGSFGSEVLRFDADWKTHHPDWCPGEWCRRRSYCVGAGPRRNQQMLDEGKPEVAFGFVDKPLPESKGSNDMATRLKAVGVVTYVIERVA